MQQQLLSNPNMNFKCNSYPQCQVFHVIFSLSAVHFFLRHHILLRKNSVTSYNQRPSLIELLFSWQSTNTSYSQQFLCQAFLYVALSCNVSQLLCSFLNVSQIMECFKTFYPVNKNTRDIQLLIHLSFGHNKWGKFIKQTLVHKLNCA